MTRVYLAHLLTLLVVAPAGAFDYRALHLLEDRNTHLILRLSEAPEGGDLPERGRADCTAVNALNRKGRNLAAGFARALNRSSIGFAAVFTSRLCRNIEAAVILHLGPVKVEEALDPLAEGTLGEAQLDDVYALIEARRPSDTMLLLTHESVIRALTGEGLGVGEAMVIRLPPFGEVEVRARFGLPPI